jgi:hypothetical protein
MTFCMELAYLLKDSPFSECVSESVSFSELPLIKASIRCSIVYFFIYNPP